MKRARQHGPERPERSRRPPLLAATPRMRSLKRIVADTRQLGAGADPDSMRGFGVSSASP
jgi:hypothetical protein